MKRIVVVLGCVLSLGVAKVDMSKPVPLWETLKVSAEEINKALPTMIDGELRHDKVEVDVNTMTFKFTLVNFTAEEMSAEKLAGFMEADIREGVCGDSDTQMMLKRRMKVVYDYVGKKKKHITQFTYDAKSCGLETNLDNLKKILKLTKNN